VITYLKERGWSLAVIGGTKVRSRGELKHNFEFVVDFTGTAPSKEAT
jgi:hypothetical protein